jgi:hypothetical protein
LRWGRLEADHSRPHQINHPAHQWPHSRKRIAAFQFMQSHAMPLEEGAQQSGFSRVLRLRDTGFGFFESRQPARPAAIGGDIIAGGFVEERQDVDGGFRRHRKAARTEKLTFFRHFHRPSIGRRPCQVKSGLTAPGRPFIALVRQKAGA